VLKDKETQESEQSLQSPREGDQVDILKSKGTVGKEKAEQDGSRGLKVMQESTQLDSLDKVGEDLTKSQRTRLQKKEKNAEKRKGEQEVDQESRDTSNRSTNKTTLILNRTQQMGLIKEEIKRRKR
jgi:hypothetical protein